MHGRLTHPAPPEDSTIPRQVYWIYALSTESSKAGRPTLKSNKQL